MNPGNLPGSSSRENGVMEIQSAIDAVRFSAKHPRETLRTDLQALQNRMQSVLRANNHVNDSVMVPVRGHVPETFLKWLRSYKEQVFREARILRRCDLGVEKK